ncbi:hypothetical protein FOZ62_006808, partial [Perkinsus olseni]
VGLRDEFEKIRNGLHLSLVELGRAGDAQSSELSQRKWIKLTYLDDSTGHSVDYYLNTETGDIRWQPPLLDITKTLSRAFSSNESLGDASPPTPAEIATELNEFHEAVRKFQDATGTVDITTKGPQSKESSGLYEHGHSDRISAQLLQTDEEAKPSPRPKVDELPKNVAFASTSGDLSEDDVKNVMQYKTGGDGSNSQFIKYSSRPWSIYKQASSIVV